MAIKLSIDLEDGKMESHIEGIETNDIEHARVIAELEMLKKNLLKKYEEFKLRIEGGDE